MTHVIELSASVVKSSEVLNVPVKNKNKEDLGKIEELVIDKVNGNVRYAVLSFGGILGLGDKLFAIPWQLLSYTNEEECFIINVPKEKLKNAQGFNKNAWPDMADQTWNTDIYKYYDAKHI